MRNKGRMLVRNSSVFYIYILSIDFVLQRFSGPCYCCGEKNPLIDMMCFYFPRKRKIGRIVCCQEKEHDLVRHWNSHPRL